MLCPDSNQSVTSALSPRSLIPGRLIILNIMESSSNCSFISLTYLSPEIPVSPQTKILLPFKIDISLMFFILVDIYSLPLSKLLIVLASLGPSVIIIFL